MLDFSFFSKQQALSMLLLQAYCAFNGKYKAEEYDERDIVLPAVCTGNWGCGAFGGDKQLKGELLSKSTIGLV